MAKFWRAGTPRVTAVVACGVLAAAVATLVAAGSATGTITTVRHYDACLQSGSSTCSTQNLPAASTVAFSFTITNRPESTTVLGSADLAAPSGFAINTASAQPSGVVGVGSTSRELELRNLNLPPNSSVVVTFNVTTPCQAGPSTKWSLVAKPTSSYGGSTTFTPMSVSGLTSSISGGGGSVDHFVVALPAAPFTATAGQPFMPTITAQTACNATATSFNGTATLTSTMGAAESTSPSPAGIQSGGPGATIGFTNGISQPSVTAVKAETSRTLHVASGAAAGTSAPFDVGAGAATQIAFSQQPAANIPTNGLFGVAVSVQDAYGNPVTGAGNVQLSLNPPSDPTAGGVGAHLAGQTSVAASGGTASFTGLAVDTSGIGYTLTAALGSAQATSSLFDVFDQLTQCSGSGCNASSTSSSATVSVAAPDTGGMLGVGLAAPPASAPCTLLNGTTQTVQTRGSSFQIVPPVRNPASDPYDIKVTLTLVHPGVGIGQLIVCKSYSDRGNGLFQVPQCPQPAKKWLTNPTGAPFACIVSQTGSQYGSATITLLINSEDPWGFGGG